MDPDPIITELFFHRAELRPSERLTVIAHRHLELMGRPTNSYWLQRMLGYDRATLDKTRAMCVNKRVLEYFGENGNTRITDELREAVESRGQHDPAA